MTQILRCDVKDCAGVIDVGEKYHPLWFGNPQYGKRIDICNDHTSVELILVSPDLMNTSNWTNGIQVIVIDRSREVNNAGL